MPQFSEGFYVRQVIAFYADCLEIAWISLYRFKTTLSAKHLFAQNVFGIYSTVYSEASGQCKLHDNDFHVPLLEAVLDYRFPPVVFAVKCEFSRTDFEGPAYALSGIPGTKPLIFTAHADTIIVPKFFIFYDAAALSRLAYLLR